MTETNGREPKAKINRPIQDKIGRELRALYEELLRQPLPEHLIAPLRSLDHEAALRDLSETIKTKSSPKRARGKRTRAGLAALIVKGA
jgi:hypothetical protein